MKEKFLFLLIILSLVVTACGGAETETPALVAPTEAAPTEAPTEAMPTEAVQPEPTTAPTEAPVMEPTAVPTEPETAKTLRLPDLEGRTVVAVTGNNYTPLNFVDPSTGEAVGWEYDAVNEICRRLNCQVDWQVTSWATMISAVKEAQFDVGMDGITITDERKQEVDFSDPYMVSQQFMLVRAEQAALAAATRSLGRRLRRRQHRNLGAARADQRRLCRDAGYIGVARSELPSLSNDVVVMQSEEETAARARRVTLGFDLGIDLGSAFYLSGKGLNTRVEGAVRLRSAGRGAVTAVGSIEAVDGYYEGFGQKLKIARGRLNFQGAPENPGLDILALRTGLPVEVGVTITRTAIATNGLRWIGTQHWAWQPVACAG